MPSWRSTRLAPWGICQVIGPVRDTTPRTSPMSSGPPPAPSSTSKPPGSGQVRRSNRQAGGRAKSEAERVHLGEAALRVTEEPGDGSEPVAGADHADTVAELEHEVVMGDEIIVAAFDTR